MARFRGTVQGGRGEASRLGHASTGIRVYAGSYSGGVRTIMYVDDYTGTDCVMICAERHSYGSKEPYGVLYAGPISGLHEMIDWWNKRDEIRALVALLDTTEGQSK